jgi:hypothetical protein
MRTCVRAATRTYTHRVHARSQGFVRVVPTLIRGADLRRPPRPRRHGTDFAEISKVVGTRTSTQVRTHVQKYHLKLVRSCGPNRQRTTRLRFCSLPSLHTGLTAPS